MKRFAIRATVSINVKAPVPAANAICTPEFSIPSPLPYGPEIKYEYGVYIPEKNFLLIPFSCL